MSAPPTTGQPLENILDGAPANQLDPEMKKRLVAYCRDLDSPGRQDARTHETYIDEAQYHNFLRKYVSPASVDGCINTIKQPSGKPTVLARTAEALAGGYTVAMGLVGLATRLRVTSSSAETLGDLGLSMSSSPTNIRQAIQVVYPDLPDAAFDSTNIH
jgi:hypothetical protein